METQSYKWVPDSPVGQPSMQAQSRETHKHMLKHINSPTEVRGIIHMLDVKQVLNSFAGSG